MKYRIKEQFQFDIGTQTEYVVEEESSSGEWVNSIIDGDLWKEFGTSSIYIPETSFKTNFFNKAEKFIKAKIQMKINKSNDKIARENLVLSDPVYYEG